MAEPIKVQGFRGHVNDEPHVICVVCPNPGCGFRQGVLTPGLFHCRCGTAIDVAAHAGWKAFVPPAPPILSEATPASAAPKPE